MSSKTIQERLDRARTLLNEVITMAKKDRQYALLEILVLFRRELALLQSASQGTMPSKTIQERLDRAHALLNEAFVIAKEDRQYALLEILVPLRKELAPLQS